MTQNKGISLACCVSPSYKALTDNGKHEPIKELCTQYQMPFLYYGTEPKIIDYTAFQDRTHMNDKGAKLYTCKLMSWIKDNLLLKYTSLWGKTIIANVDYNCKRVLIIKI